MKRITLKQISLLNFKGIKGLTVDFGDTVTTISGKNGTGKTTIFDAFTWLLFGKESKGRKAFNIKTIDDKGDAIQRLLHEVSAVISVNGDEITLCRQYKEKWQKKRGSEQEEFTGHEETRLYNNVPMSVAEWYAKISGLCNEQVFKYITNPLFFSEQETELQRQLLFRMAGDVSDESIAKDNADFFELLSELSGKTLDEYKREIAATKKRVKSEMDGIPDRIDERRRSMPEAEDWNALSVELEQAECVLSNIDAKIKDKAEAHKAASDERLKISQTYSDLNGKKIQIEYEIKQKVNAKYNDSLSKRTQIKRELETVEQDVRNLDDTIIKNQDSLAQLEREREYLISEWKEIKSRSITFDEKDFVCPTCKRPFDIDDIEAKQYQLTEAFNQKKAQDLEANTAKGKEVKSNIEKKNQCIAELKQKKEDLIAKEQELKSNPLLSEDLLQVDATPIINSDSRIIELTRSIKELEAKLNEPLQIPETTGLESQKREVVAKMDELKARLAKKETIERDNERISELEKQLRALSSELARLEGIEFKIAAFSKAKVEAIETRINGMFTVVRFKMFEKLINGGEQETCEATVDGVPYSDLNSAMRINAGIDIINAICKSEGISAPIFIDNAESVNELMETESQVVRLVVTTEKQLTIHNNQ